MTKPVHAESEILSTDIPGVYIHIEDMIGYTNLLKQTMPVKENGKITDIKITKQLTIKPLFPASMTEEEREQQLQKFFRAAELKRPMSFDDSD